MAYSISHPPAQTQCLYCSRSDADATFRNRAHVLPQTLGRFTPDNLFFKGDLVCDECDNVLGGDIEQPFARDAAEAVVARLHRRARSPVPVVDVEGSMFQLDISCTPVTPVNPKLFFIKSLFEAADTPTSMAIVESPDRNWYAYVNVDKAEKLTPGTYNYRKNYKKLNRFRKSKVISEVIGQTDKDIQRGVAVLKKLGINFEQLSDIMQPDRQAISCNIEITQSISEPIARTLAKIAFTHFAYCAEKSGYREQLFAEEFRPILEYIRYGRGNKSDFIDMSKDTRVISPPDIQQHFYTLTFAQENNEIVATMSLLGEVAYHIKIGPYKFSGVAPKKQFGCGHSFSLITKGVSRLHSSRIPRLGNSFSIFGR